VWQQNFCGFFGLKKWIKKEINKFIWGKNRHTLETTKLMEKKEKKEKPNMYSNPKMKPPKETNSELKLNDHQKQQQHS
jgi:hypothetical protein